MKSWISSAFDEPLSSAPPRRESAKIQSSISTRARANEIDVDMPPPSLSLFNKPNLATQAASSIKRSSDKNNDGKNLCEKYEPKNRADLVVNAKKVEQLSALLDELVKKQKGLILVIEGPSGSGKNTALKILCKEKSIELVNWTATSIRLDSFNTGLQDEKENNEFETRENVYESQVSLFEQFLFKSSRYLTDQIFDTGSDRRAKILFVKEIPNFAYRDPASFQKLLRQFKFYSKYSIIFTIQTVQSTNSDSNPHRLFTSDIRHELGILELGFNAIANTYLVKHIDRICKLEGLISVDKKIIESLCVNCNGDLRHAVNMLELVRAEQNSSLKKPVKKMVATSGVKRRKIPGKSAFIDSATEASNTKNYFEHNLKDPSYNIFRGIGKVMHRKNLEFNDANRFKFEIERKLPQHLQRFERTPMSVDPEDIYNKINISPDLTLMYLYQNYIDMYNLKTMSSDKSDEEKFDALTSMMDNFLHSDLINRRSNLVEMHSVQDTRIKELSSLISIRSVLFHFNFEDTPTSSLKKTKSGSSWGGGVWMPLYKPFNAKMNEMRQKRKKLAKELILSNEYNDPCLIQYLTDTHKEFFINYLPYFVMKAQLTNRRLHDPQSLLFAKYKATNSKYSAGQSNENDVVDESEMEVVQRDVVIVEKLEKEAETKGNYTYEDNEASCIIDFYF